MNDMMFTLFDQVTLMKLHDIELVRDTAEKVKKEVREKVEKEIEEEITEKVSDETESNMANLMAFLVRNQRYDDIIRAASDQSFGSFIFCGDPSGDLSPNVVSFNTNIRL